MSMQKGPMRGDTCLKEDMTVVITGAAGFIGAAFTLFRCCKKKTKAPQPTTTRDNDESSDDTFHTASEEKSQDGKTSLVVMKSSNGTLIDLSKSAESAIPTKDEEETKKGSMTFRRTKSF